MPPLQLFDGHADERILALRDTIEYLRSRLPKWACEPKVAIICGSGLGGLVNTLDKTRIEFDYSEIPNFINSTVEGHAGKLVFGLLGVKKTPVVCMVGRFHIYEGHTKEQITFPIRVFKLLGVEILLVTNATGSLNHEHFQVGSIMVMADHISLPNMTGSNPLIGPNMFEFGPRFIPTSDAYDFELREIAFRAATSLNFPKGALKEGTYCWVIGPSYETRAESRYLESIGGDVVGMSTVPEVIVARHCGLRVLGLSLVTNMVILRKPRSADPLKKEGPIIEKHSTHAEVLEASQEWGNEMQKLVRTIIEMI
ncbi:hypothetical protein G9A89_012431 [Geosiphon pyriformis]|nr:hypothetical protein G9A89_012431 [Geosiphon pyriformis]